MKPLIIMICILSLYSISAVANDYDRIIHIQTPVEDAIFVIVQKKDKTWDLGFIQCGDFKATTELAKVEINQQEGTISFYDGMQVTTNEIVGEHHKISCFPYCPGCVGNW